MRKVTLRHRSSWPVGPLHQAGLKSRKINISDRSVFHEVEQLCKQYSLDLADGFQIYTLKKGFFSVLPGDSSPILITADDALADAVKLEGYRVWHVLKEPEPKEEEQL